LKKKSSNLKFAVNKRKILRSYDPTHTTAIRNQFARELKKRFGNLIKDIKEAIVDRDCFGLNELSGYAAPLNRAFNFPRSQDKVAAFMDWLDRQVRDGLLEVKQGEQLGQAIEQAWTNTYIQSAYQKGLMKARSEIIKAGYDVPELEKQGGLGVVLNGPMHADRIGLLYTRTYSELKGITDAMENQISKVLSLGMAEGRNPRQLAQMLNKVVSGAGADLGITDTLGRFIPAKRRAEMLARTEIIRAHHQAKVAEMKSWEVEGVYVVAELATAKDGRVCPDCAGLEGKQYSLEEAERLIPVHPNCRCTIVPVKGKKESKEEEPIELPSEERNDWSLPDISPDSPIYDILRQDSYYYTSLGHVENTVLADNWLVQLVKLQKMDGLPNRVSKEQFDSIKGITLYRGVTDPLHKIQFLSGEYFGGTGVYGNGNYFAMSKREALGYALDKAENVITAKLPESAKVIHWDDLKKEMAEWSKKVESKTGFVPISKLVNEGTLTEEQASVWLSFKELGKDPGRYCALKGYDAIRVPIAGGGEQDYFVVVNRTALTVLGD